MAQFLSLMPLWAHGSYGCTNQWNGRENDVNCSLGALKQFITFAPCHRDPRKTCGDQVFIAWVPRVYAGRTSQGRKKIKSCAFKTAEFRGVVCYPGTRQSVLADSESSSFPPGTDLRCRNASQQLRGWEKCTCFYVFRLIASFPYCLWEFVFFLLLSFLVPNLFLICFPCWASTTSYFPRLFLVAPFYPEGNSSHLDAQGFFSSF